jgi:hypothetical protein
MVWRLKNAKVSSAMLGFSLYRYLMFQQQGSLGAVVATH